MKSVLTSLIFALVLVFTNNVKAAGIPVDSVHKTSTTVKAYAKPDSLSYVQFVLLSSTNVQLQNSTWFQVKGDTSYSFGGLTAMTTYKVRVDTFPNGTGTPKTFTTDTVVVAPTFVFDSIVRFATNNQAVFYFHGFNGNDTANVTIQTCTNNAFIGAATWTGHLTFNNGVGAITASYLLNNGTTYYYRMMKKNSFTATSWTTTDTFSLSLPVVVVQANPRVDSIGSVTANTATVWYSADDADESWIILNNDSLSALSGNGTLIGAHSYPGGAVQNAVGLTGLVANTQYYVAHVVRLSNVQYSAVKGFKTVAITGLTMSFVITDTTTTTAKFVVTPNSNGYHIDSFVVKVGSPNLSSIVQWYHLPQTGIYNGSTPILFSVTGLTYSTHYQIEVIEYTHGVGFQSTVIPFVTNDTTILPVTAFTAYMDPNTYVVGDSIHIGYYAISENEAASVGGEQATWPDSSFTNAIELSVNSVQSQGGGISVYKEIVAEWTSLPDNQYYGYRVFGFNSANATGPFYAAPIWVAKNITGIQIVSNDPNSTTRIANLTLTYPQARNQSVRLVIADLAGHEVYNAVVQNNGEAINVNVFSKGMYVCAMFSGSKRIASGKVMIF